ncbi:hypothetical protein FACS1894111_08170 [Clostridia bacterium]|nr:hypothetical protein FACS1894111_08170 [Clostridia bacterium]
MNKTPLKIFVLCLVFIGTVITALLLNGKSQTDLSSEMKEATLPVIYLKSGEVQINALYGYLSEMNPLTMRDTITPLPEDLKLPIQIATYNAPIDSLSYVVRTMDGKRLLEDTKLSDFNQTDGNINAQLPIQNLLEQGEEYMLILHLQSEGKDIAYYTRIIRPVNASVEDCLNFVKEFHDRTFTKEDNSWFSGYMEPDREGDNTTLQKVTIHSSLNQLTWAEFGGQPLGEASISIEEISPYYNTFVLRYIMTNKGEDGETEYYNVKEMFRVRYNKTGARASLLDYERDMSEIFRGSKDNIEAAAIRLGIRDSKVEYGESNTGTVVCFVQEGELFSYNKANGRLSMVFSFRDKDNFDLRENNPNHDIRIIRVAEDDSIDFVVYGYMNRGEREGRCGVAAYHYDSLANTTKELIFAESGKSYEVLKEDWGKLFYVSDTGSFYMIAESTLYQIDLKDQSVNALVSDLDPENYAFSDTGRYLAYRGQDAGDPITILDLESNAKQEISAEEGDTLRPVGFVDSDFIYGQAHGQDVVPNALFPMYRVTVMDKDKNIIKTYEKSDYYVTNAYVEKDTIFLDRVHKEGASYLPVSRDALKNPKEEENTGIRVAIKTLGAKETIVTLEAAKNFAKTKPQILTAKEAVLPEQKEAVLSEETSFERYYVYAMGSVIACTGNAPEAIQTADSAAAVVIGTDQKYVWQRGKANASTKADKVVLSDASAAQHTNPQARCLSAILSLEGVSLDVEGLLNGGTSVADILQTAMPDARVLNLSGCRVSQVLYYVSLGTPVYAIGAGGTPVLIAGYDERNTVLYDPASNKTYKKGLQDSDTFFRGGGNSFVVYVK